MTAIPRHDDVFDLGTVLTARQFCDIVMSSVRAEAAYTEEHNEHRTLADYLADLSGFCERASEGDITFSASACQAAMVTQRTEIAAALTSHRIECVMTAENSFGWHCLTCGAESHSWSSLEAAEQASLVHHVDAVMDAVHQAQHAATARG